MTHAEAAVRSQAAQCGVTVERVLEVRAARARYRLARMYRMRSRARGKKWVRYGWRMKSETQHLLAGEGRFHELLKIAGLTEETFAHLIGIAPQRVGAWQGHPLSPLPVLFLELLVQNRNMAQKLEQHGWKADSFKAGKLPPAPVGRYPRTAEQGRALIRAAENAVRADEGS